MINEKDGCKYQLATKHGIIEHWYTRNQFAPTLEKFLNFDNVNLVEKISLRAAAKQQSVTGTGSLGTTFQCHCRGKCLDKRCQFKRKNLQCNSRCHKKHTSANRAYVK